MNAAYLRVKGIRDRGKPLPASTLDRMVNDQQKKLARLTVSEWRKVGTDLAQKTAAMAGSAPKEREKETKSGS